MITQKQIIHLYDKAVQMKSDVKPLLNEILDYTSEYGRITDTINRGLVSRSIDPTIADAKDNLVNFVMNTIFGVREIWTRFNVPLNLLKKKYPEAVAKKIFTELTQQLNEETEITFQYLFESNYYVEIYKAVEDATNLGTGCYKTIPLKAATKPFTFQYVSLDNLFILEDTFGMPDIVFKKYYEQTEVDLIHTFTNIKIPEELLRDKLTEHVDILECVIPEYIAKDDTTVYHHMVFTDGFGQQLKHDVLDYNPFRVFRNMIVKGTPWGKGAGAKALDAMKRLRYYKAMRAKQVAKMVDPPVGFIGDKSLAMQFTQKPGGFNWLGDPMVGKNVDVKNVGVFGNLLPLDQDIQLLKNEIRDIYLAKPFGDINETGQGAKSTVEIQRRFELFKERYSGTANIFYNELLAPTFWTPFKILESKGITKLPKDAKEGITLTFVNELTKSADQEEVGALSQAVQMINGLFPDYAKFVFKEEKAAVEIAKKMNVKLEFINKEDDIKNQFEQLQAQQQALAAQQLGSAKENGMQGADQLMDKVTGKNDGGMNVK